jgi:rod shape-determining protein MreC
MRDTQRSRALLASALITALALIAVGKSGGSLPVIGAARATVGTAFGDAERMVSRLTRPAVEFLRSGLAGDSGSGQAAGLERQLLRVRADLTRADLALGRYRQVRSLLRVSRSGGYRIRPAQVVAFGQGIRRTVTLDVGRADGVAAGQTVLDGDGLVGQVTVAYPRTCTVLLASDPSSAVGVRLVPSGEIGWVTGQGSGRAAAGLLRLRVLNPTVVLTPGEQLVTAASVRDRPFVPGVPVGVITLVRRHGTLTVQALVRPFANLTALDVVGVVIGPPRTDPRYAVLRPPRGHSR